MRLYCIEQLDTGLYYLNGEWCEEPEWFSANEVYPLFRSLCDPSPLAVRHEEFDDSEG